MLLTRFCAHLFGTATKLPLRTTMIWLPPTADAADLELLERVAALPGYQLPNDLTRTNLQQMAAGAGNDFATALLYERLLRCDAIRDTLEAVTASVPEPRRDVLIGLVPGAFYKEYALTGADGQRVLDAARQSGMRAERVPVESFGSLQTNARIITGWLKDYRASEICLISLSKGGADVQYALSEPDADRQFANVSTWINLSGILQGTALANWLLGTWWRTWMIRAYAWWLRYSFEVVHEIKRDGNECLTRALDWPKHLRVFHVVGFPLRRHLRHPFALRAHRRIEPWGPSDGGGVLLADAVRWPGTIVPLWGADHYMQHEAHDVAGLVMRLLSREHAQSHALQASG